MSGTRTPQELQVERRSRDAGRVGQVRQCNRVEPPQARATRPGAEVTRPGLACSAGPPTPGQGRRSAYVGHCPLPPPLPTQGRSGRRCCGALWALLSGAEPRHL